MTGRRPDSPPAARPASPVQKWKVPHRAGRWPPKALLGERLFLLHTGRRPGSDSLHRCPRRKNRFGRDAAAASSGPRPAIRAREAHLAVAEGKVVTLGVAGVLSCLDADMGKVTWRKTHSPRRAPALHRLLAAGRRARDGNCSNPSGKGEVGGAILAFDLASGEEKWRWAEEGPNTPRPPVDGRRAAAGCGAHREKRRWGRPADGKLRALAARSRGKAGAHRRYADLDGDLVIFAAAAAPRR